MFFKIDIIYIIKSKFINNFIIFELIFTYLTALFKNSRSIKSKNFQIKIILFLFAYIISSNSTFLIYFAVKKLFFLEKISQNINYKFKKL